MKYKNLDMHNLVTPVDADCFEYLLTKSNYPVSKCNFVIQGFRSGFDLGYAGPVDVQLNAPNLKLREGSHTILWNKVMKEVKLLRYAGPFEEIPFHNFIQSLIGLVPKDRTDTRLIFHLSYPKKGTSSVNANTPQELCKVKYLDIDDAIRIILNCSSCKPVFLSKSHFQSAFRVLGLHPKCWR